MKRKTRSLRESFKSGTGKVFVIGGHEDRTGEKIVLNEIAREIRHGKIVIATLASHTAPKELWEQYNQAFKDLGVKKVEHLDINTRLDASSDERLEILKGADAIFFTGGDQLRITSQLGGTRLSEEIRKLFDKGASLCGTSAGAAIMGETMLVSGHSGESHRIESALRMAPGLGYLRNIVVDQHFAERGRLGRLLASLAQNPEYLGVGIDEDTCIIVDDETSFRVVGAGAVYVLDGWGVTNTNISDASSDETMSIYDVKLHVLSNNDVFYLKDRRPQCGGAEELKRAA